MSQFGVLKFRSSLSTLNPNFVFLYFPRNILANYLCLAPYGAFIILHSHFVRCAFIFELMSTRLSPPLGGKLPFWHMFSKCVLFDFK